MYTTPYHNSLSHFLLHQFVCHFYKVKMAFLRVLSFFGRPISTYDRQRSASAVAVRDLSTKEFSLINELTSTEEKPSYIGLFINYVVVKQGELGVDC